MSALSLESSTLCVVDATGRVVREARITSEPEALTAWLKGLGYELCGLAWKQDNRFNRYQPELGAEVGLPIGLALRGGCTSCLPAAVCAAMLLGCSLSPRPMLPLSVRSSTRRESCQLLSSYAGGSRGSPTTRRRVHTLGASPVGRRCHLQPRPVTRLRPRKDS